MIGGQQGEPMIRIVYVSTAMPTLKDEHLADILQVANVRNAGLGITGLLVHNGRNFMQALEGPADCVLEVMSSISRDARHDGVIVISRETITERAFPDWSMKLAQVGRAAGNAENLLISNGLDYAVVATMPGPLATMFTNFNSLD